MLIKIIIILKVEPLVSIYSIIDLIKMMMMMTHQ